MPWARRAVLGLVAGLAVRRAGVQAAPAPLSLVVGAPTGSGGDRWARGFAPFIERHWPGRAVTVLNHPGEGGLRAARSVADADQDGRTAGVISAPALLARALERDSPDLLERLDFVAAVVEEPVVLVTSAEASGDLAALRELGDRGLVGCPPPGSAGHLAWATLQEALPLAPFIFPSAAAARQAVLAGNLNAALLPMPDVQPALVEGRLLGIAVSGEARTALTPDMPLFQEIGLPKVLSSRRGLILPRDVPPPVRSSLVTALQGAVSDPELLAQAAENGYVPEFLTGTAWASTLQRLAEALRQQWEQEPWARRQG